MSDTLIFQCGDYTSAIQNQDVSVTVLGDLKSSQEEMFLAGYNLRLSDGHVFSNDTNVLLGMQYAVVQGKLDSTKVLIELYTEFGVAQTITINSLGQFNDPPEDFFGRALVTAKLIALLRRDKINNLNKEEK